MDQPNFRKIHKRLRNNLDYPRYEHTLGVAYTASALAMRYGADVQNAILAGLLHDYAKCISNQKKMDICEKYKITVSEIEFKNPYLLHAKIGSFLAMKKFGVRDKDVINAILNHTTGRPNMSLLEKILYVADYIEPHRKKVPDLAEIRQLAFEDIDHALLYILKNTLVHLNSIELEPDSITEITYEYYNDKFSEYDLKII